jgi:hypothetical protein
MKTDSGAWTCSHYFVTDFALTVYESPLLEIEGQKSTLSWRKIVQQVTYNFYFCSFQLLLLRALFVLVVVTIEKSNFYDPTY